MLTQPQVNFPSAQGYDPLQIQFMTGGQMGYMPDAQYLTPPEYGTFRTIPNANLATDFNQRDQGFLSNMLIARRGSLLGSSAYAVNTYKPWIDPKLQQAYALRRESDSMLAAGGAAVSVGMAAAGMMVGGPLGLIAPAILPNPMDWVQERRKTSREIQDFTTPKISFGSSVSKDTGYGFNYRTARDIDKFIRDKGADDTIFKEGDLRNMMKLGVEHGLFDYANSGAQYKQTLSTIKGTMSTMMEVLGSTDFKDVMKDLKRMQSLGASMNEFKGIARQEQTFQRILGMSHQAMTDIYGKSGALAFQQHGLNAMTGSLQAEQNAANITMMQRAGLISPQQLARFGGVSGFAQRMTQQDAAGLATIKDFVMPYFMNNAMTGLGGASPLDLLKPGGFAKVTAGANKIMTPQQMMNYKRFSQDAQDALIKQYGADEVLLLNAAAIGQQVGMKGLDAQRFGLMRLGYDSEVAFAKVQSYHSEGAKSQREKVREAAMNKEREERAQRYSTTGDIKRFASNLVQGIKEGFSGLGIFTPETKADEGYTPFISSGGGLVVGRGTGFGFDTGSYDPTGVGSSAPSFRGRDKQIGWVSRQHESNNNVAKVGYDDTGGYSYGLYQFASRGKNNSMGEFVKWLQKQGGEKAQVAEELLAATGGNFDSQQGKTAYLKAVSDPDKRKVFEMAEQEYAEEQFYKTTLKKLPADLRAQIESSPALKEMVVSTAIQHGPGGAAGILKNNWGDGSKSIDQFIGDVYADRKTRFPSSKPNIRAGVQKRLTEEANLIQGIHRLDENPVDQETVNASVQNAISEMSARHSVGGSEPLRYVFGKKSMNPNGPGIDCSGYVEGTQVAAMKRVNEETGAPVFTKEHFDLFDTNSAGQIRNVAKYTGWSLTGDAAKDTSNWEAGMLIGVDKKDGRGITHVARVIERDGQKLVSHAESSKTNVVEDTLEDFLRKNKKRDLTVVDTRTIGNWSAQQSSQQAAVKDVFNAGEAAATGTSLGNIQTSEGFLANAPVAGLLFGNNREMSFEEYRRTQQRFGLLNAEERNPELAGLSTKRFTGFLKKNAELGLGEMTETDLTDMLKRKELKNDDFFESEDTAKAFLIEAYKRSHGGEGPSGAELKAIEEAAKRKDVQNQVAMQNMRAAKLQGGKSAEMLERVRTSLDEKLSEANALYTKESKKMDKAALGTNYASLLAGREITDVDEAEKIFKEHGLDIDEYVKVASTAGQSTRFADFGDGKGYAEGLASQRLPYIMQQLSVAEGLRRVRSESGASMSEEQKSQIKDMEDAIKNDLIATSKKLGIDNPVATANRIINSANPGEETMKVFGVSMEDDNNKAFSDQTWASYKGLRQDASAEELLQAGRYARDTRGSFASADAAAAHAYKKRSQDFFTDMSDFGLGTGDMDSLLARLNDASDEEVDAIISQFGSVKGGANSLASERLKELRTKRKKGKKISNEDIQKILVDQVYVGGDLTGASGSNGLASWSEATTNQDLARQELEKQKNVAGGGSTEAAAAPTGSGGTSGTAPSSGGTTGTDSLVKVSSELNTTLTQLNTTLREINRLPQQRG